MAHLKHLLTDITGQAWGTMPFYVTLAVTGIILFFGAGTIARVIFGKDTGLFRTAFATLLVLAAAAAAFAAAGMYGASANIAYVAAGVAALAAVWLAAKILGTPYGQTFGIMIFSVAITIGAAIGAGKVCSVLAESAKELEKKQELNPVK